MANDAQHLITFTLGEETWSAEVSTGVSLFEAARAAHAPVETLCHGIGACVRCKVKLLSGEVGPPTPLERDRLGNIFHITRERLACQTLVTGNASLEIPARRIRPSARRKHTSTPTSN